MIPRRYGRRLLTRIDVGYFLWLRFGRIYPLRLTFLLVLLDIEIVKHGLEHSLGIPLGAFAFNSC